MRRRTSPHETHHHHQRHNAGRRSSDDPYSERRRPAAASSTRAWLLPLLSQRLGIRNKRQQEILLVASIAILLAIWFLTPLSDFAASLVLMTVPIDSDVALGREALISLEQKYPPLVDRWGVKSIGLELVKSSKRNKLFDNMHQYEWDFGIVHAPQIVNAFALPGGIVRVTDTLLKNLALTDGELAALLGHEIGHVLHRHTQKRAIKKRLISTVFDALVYEDNDGYDESFGEAVGEGLWNAASHLGELSFSRADEYQADDVAWNLLASTYSSSSNTLNHYHPRSVRRLLRKLWDYHGGSGRADFLSTHPGTKDRIDALEKKWNSLPLAEKLKFA